MEYTINKLAKLAGVTTRTLRHYDEIGLLSPTRSSSNGYRIYGQPEVDKLQHILFYRELGLPLDEIKQLVNHQNFNPDDTLNNHLLVLQAKREQLNILIATVEKTILTKKGVIKMTNEEKFNGFKQQLIDDNEQKYGVEIREIYGNDMVDASYAKIIGMSQADYDAVTVLEQELMTTLQAAFEQGDPASELGQKVAELHKKWLCYYWQDYSRAAHIGLAEMYVADERFKAHYDKIADGCAEFLRDAVVSYCKSSDF